MPETVDDAARALFNELASRPFDPATSLAEGARLHQLAVSSNADERVPPRRTELFVRFAGVGVEQHRMPVAQAAEMLELLQSAVTNIGTVNLHGGKVPRGVRRATRLFVTPDVHPGSLVFRLEADDADYDPQEALEGTEGTGSLIDAALADLMGLISAAETNGGSDIDALAERMRPFGPGVTSRLNGIATETRKAKVDLDLGLWSRNGRRRHVNLGQSAASAFRAAADRNRTKIDDPIHVEGVLHTVSDKDLWRLEVASGKDLKLKIDPSFDLADAGSLIFKRVRATIEVRIEWSLASGKETKEYRLLDAVELEADGDDAPGPLA